MTLKSDLLGWLLNAQVLLSAAAALLPRRAGVAAWGGFAAAAAAAVAVRWTQVGHPPMRNLFEAFLWLPLCLGAVSLLERWREGCWRLRLDGALGFVVAFPAAFVFSAQVGQLPPALQSPLFVPHVLGYMAAYILLARAFFLACAQAQRAMHRNAAWGFCLLTVALALGSIWGNEAWGGYWQWDPKEQWSLATWLLYAAFFHCPAKQKWRLALLGAGLVAILLTLTWINLSKLFPGLHSYAGI